MNDVLGMYIKDVITSYPAVGGVLTQAGIGCVTCSVGTCLLKDVVSIHNLTESQEETLFAGIARIIFPGQTMKLPKTARKMAVPVSRKLSPPLQDLVNEHANIKRVIAVLPALAEALRPGLTPSTRQAVLDALDFIRQYADRFHHAKEEEILFRYFDHGSDILAVMHKEHEIGRGHVWAATTALEQGNVPAVIEHLNAYGVLLQEHIRKEDEILYPWMNSLLSDSQVGQLFTKFGAVDKQFEAGIKNGLGVAERLEKGFTPERGETT